MMSKNLKWAYFGEKNKMYGPDQNIGSPEKFCLSNVQHFRSLFQKWIHPTNARPFKPFLGTLYPVWLK